jgi:hypothetical protein
LRTDHLAALAPAEGQHVQQLAGARADRDAGLVDLLPGRDRFDEARLEVHAVAAALVGGRDDRGARLRAGAPGIFVGGESQWIAQRHRRPLGLAGERLARGRQGRRGERQ